MNVGRVLNMHGLFKSAAVAVTVLALSACGGQPTEDAANSPSTQISLTPQSPGVVFGGTISFSATNGTAPYVYGIVSGAGTIDATTGQFTAPNAAGSVIVGVLDQAGKTATTTVTVVGPVNIAPPVTNVLAGGSRSFSGTGGQTPYTYSVISGAGTINASTGVYSVPSGAGAGSATVRITDAWGQTANATVTIYPQLTLSPATISIAINDTQSFTASGGMGGYTYSVLSGGGSINPSTGLYTAPAAPTTVTIQVSDSGANTATATVNVVGPLFISPATWEMAANNTKTLTGVDGQPPYTYSVVSGGGSINSATGTYTAPAAADTVVVRVTDAFGQTADAAVTVQNALQISPSTLGLNTNGTHTFTATGGVGAYAYSIVSGGASINPTTGFMTAGGSPSTVTVRVTDTLGNQSDATVTVQSVLGISPTSITLAVNNVYTFNASGGQMPYTYSLVSGGGSINSATGQYTAPATSGAAVVRVTDNLGATADANITINPALSISPVAVNLLTNGSQTFTASGGVTPYTFSVVSGGGSINSSTGAYIAPATPAAVVVRVTDARGNTADANATVVNPLLIAPATFTMAVNNTRTFVASGGQAPYTFSVQTGGGSVDPSTGLYTAPATSGTAVVRVTDNLGSTADANITINPALAISPATITVGLNGSQTFSATGGAPPMTYSIVSGGGSIGSSSGAYTAPATNDSVVVRVTDSLGNTSDATVTVEDPLVISPATYTLAVNNTHTFSASGGEAPYTFSLQSGTGTVNSTSGLYTAPATAGSAVVRVTDNNGQTADATITVNPALAISPASVTIGLSATQTFTATGGVSPYTFAVQVGVGTINSTSGLYTAPATPGTATVRVTDALGNTSDASVTVANNLVISPTTWVLAVNNTRTFSATGGQTPYTYSMVSGGGSINSSTGVYTAPAASGSAVVRVTDNLGQTADATITINPALAISPASKTLAVNTNQTFTATGGVTPYTYSVFTGGGSINATTGVFTAPATAQAVVVRVTDARGNTSNSSVTVVDALSITPATLNILVDDMSTFAASGGTAPYTYSVFNGGGSIDPATGDFTAPSVAETVSVRVTDNNGFTADATVQVYEPLSIIPTTLTLAPDNTYQFTTAGGLGTITFSLVSGTGTIDPNTGDYTAPSAAGTDVVRATDSIGNTADATITINGALLISPTTKKISINETFTFTATNGVPPRTFSVEAGGGSIDPNTGVYTAPGTSQSVTVRVTDSLDNISEATVTIITPVKVWSGGYNNCVKYDDNSVKCWGDGANGKLGTAATADLGDSLTEMGSNLPFLNLGTGRYPKEMAMSINHACAILDNDSLKCWGTNTNGQLGLGDTAHRGDGAGEMGDSLPTVNVGSGRTVKKIAVGPTNTCAILDNNDLKCWGLNTYGQNGKDNTTTLGTSATQMGDNLTAINLGSGRYATEVSVGTSHVCAVLDNGSVKCWGRNNRGQLGVGSTTTWGTATGNMAGLPTVNLGTGLTAKNVRAGSEHTCAHLNDDTIKCWGRSNSGQLGQGTTSVIGDASTEMGNNLPVTSLGTGLTVSSMYLEAAHTCAWMDNGDLKCWGYGFYGELGKGSTSNLGTSAAQMGNNLTGISTNSTLSQVAIGVNHMCILSTTNEVKCWGRATQGALGSGSSTQHKGDGAGEMGASLPRVNL